MCFPHVLLRHGTSFLTQLLLSSVLSINLDALRIDDDTMLTPKASSGTLHALERTQAKGKAPALDLPPPDSDEWEATPVPATRPGSR